MNYDAVEIGFKEGSIGWTNRDVDFHLDDGHIVVTEKESCGGYTTRLYDHKPIFIAAPGEWSNAHRYNSDLTPQQKKEQEARTKKRLNSLKKELKEKLKKRKK